MRKQQKQKATHREEVAGGNAGYNYFKLFLATLWHLDQPTKGKANKQTKLKLKYRCLTTTKNLIF